MISVTLDKEAAIVTLEPEGELKEEDFDTAVKIIDPFIKIHGKLTGMIIYTKEFPGWENLAAMLRHLKFIRNHHKKVKRLAFVTDSPIGDIAEAIGSHFVSAEIKRFPYDEKKAARAWILESEE
jgi:hypothetical protein